MYFKSKRTAAPMGDTVGACTAIGPSGLNPGDDCTTPSGGTAEWSGTQLQMYGGVPFSAADQAGLTAGGFSSSQLLNGPSPANAGPLSAITQPLSSLVSTLTSNPLLLGGVVIGAVLLTRKKKAA